MLEEQPQHTSGDHFEEKTSSCFVLSEFLSAHQLATEEEHSQRHPAPFFHVHRALVLF